MSSSEENQLELFELKGSPASQTSQEVGRVRLHVRYDQLVLTCMAGLIGVTVVFACGVERGKQLARSEQRILLAKQEPPIPVPAVSTGTSDTVTTPSSVPTTSVTPVAPDETATPLRTPISPSATIKKTPTKTVQVRSRYAVQVVTYSRPQLAKQELDRLRAKGEQAFLVIRDDRTMVYVGPFPTKGNASEKMVSLKTSYRDCFIKTL